MFRRATRPLFTASRIRRKSLFFISLIVLISSLSFVLASCGDPSPPKAAVVASATTGQVPLNVTFSNHSENADEYQWDFGDGETLTTHSNGDPLPVIHGYKTVGVFTFSLMASKEGEPSHTVTLTITVQ